MFNLALNYYETFGKVDSLKLVYRGPPILSMYVSLSIHALTSGHQLMNILTILVLDGKVGTKVY